MGHDEVFEAMVKGFVSPTDSTPWYLKDEYLPGEPVDETGDIRVLSIEQGMALLNELVRDGITALARVKIFCDEVDRAIDAGGVDGEGVEEATAAAQERLAEDSDEYLREVQEGAEVVVSLLALDWEAGVDAARELLQVVTEEMEAGYLELEEGEGEGHDGS
jgi:hypothetical protein